MFNVGGKTTQENTAEHWLPELDREKAGDSGSVQKSINGGEKNNNFGCCKISLQTSKPILAISI